MTKFVFDDPVFQAVVGNHGDAAARFQNFNGLVQRLFQHFRFPVHRDAQGLEG